MIISWFFFLRIWLLCGYQTAQCRVWNVLFGMYCSCSRFSCGHNHSTENYSQLVNRKPNHGFRCVFFFSVEFLECCEEWIIVCFFPFLGFVFPFRVPAWHPARFAALKRSGPSTGFSDPQTFRNIPNNMLTLVLFRFATHRDFFLPQFLSLRRVICFACKPPPSLPEWKTNSRVQENLQTKSHH